MIFENIGFYLREALLSFKRNPLMYLAAIISITAIFIIIGLFLLISLNFNLFLKNLESQLEIIVYLEDNISESEVNDLKKSITSLEGAKEVKFVSKEEAFQRLVKDLGDQKEIFSLLEKNPLPASLEIKVKDPKMIEPMVKQIEKFKNINIEEVEYGAGIVERWLDFTGIFRVVGISILLLLLFASVLIISNILRITVYARREEIEIMSLVGASSWFIRWPFIVEGLLQGVISALISILVLYKFYFWMVDKIHEAIPFLPLVVEKRELLPLGLLLILLGGVAGFLGSVFLVGRYINA